MNDYSLRPEEIARTRAEADRPLTPEELRELDAAALTDAEREENLSLIEWFCRRYPTPADRLRYARRAYARWQAGAPDRPRRV